MTVQEALEAFCEEHKVSLSQEETKWFPIRLGPLTFYVPNPGLLRWHDLHHVATGFPPTIPGEIAISAFEWRTGSVNFIVGCLCLSALFLGLFWMPLGGAVGDATWRGGGGYAILVKSAKCWVVSTFLISRVWLCMSVHLVPVQGRGGACGLASG